MFDSKYQRFQPDSSYIEMDAESDDEVKSIEEVKHEEPDENDDFSSLPTK